MLPWDNGGINESLLSFCYLRLEAGYDIKTCHIDGTIIYIYIFR